jgi:hypothetical protein
VAAVESSEVFMIVSMDKRIIILLVSIAIIVFLLANCMQTQPSPDPRGEGYAGSAKCLSCHQAIATSYTHTAHFISTRVADTNSVEGDFSKDSNLLVINDTTQIMMEKRDSGLYQVLYVNNRLVKERRFDLTMGSSLVQTFFYWQQDGFFQLPVFYFTSTHQWSGSPGSLTSKINFSRPAVPGCFECHSSFANGDPHGISVAVAKKNNWVFNIDCERCHGPAARHVKFHETHPEEKESKYMVSFASLSRARKIDACAICHSGTASLALKSAYGFKIGDTLSAFVNVFPSNPNLIDMHGNLIQSLGLSKCFRQSAIDCTTCHDPHINEKSRLNLINEKCQSCHIPGINFCKLANDSNRIVLQNNCAACHMPKQASPFLLVQTANNESPVSIRIVNHRIGIFPEETAQVLNSVRTAAVSGRNR